MPVFSPRLSQQRMKLRPMRPNPLIATFSVMASSGKAASKGGFGRGSYRNDRQPPQYLGLAVRQQGVKHGATNLAA
jgi:hypothetical protein